MSLDLVEDWLDQNAREALVGGGANCERSNRKGIASYHAFDGLMELKVVTHYFVLCNLHISCFESNSLISFVCGAVSAVF